MGLLRKRDLPRERTPAPEMAQAAEQASLGAVPAEPEHRGDAAAPGRSEKSSWGFAEGDELAPGRTVVTALGGGSRYEVVLAWDEHRYALLVAKALRPGHAGSRSALADLLAEADALAALQHPVLVRGFGADAGGEHPHLLIEHLEGWTLRRLIKRGGPLPAEQLLPLTLHVAAALHFMAGEGWVHLDVKPDNIVMGVPPRLIDLSVARPVRAAEEIASPIGTDAYMAPEQCDPRRFPGAIGPATDVFGLGATLFHAVAGRVPFAREEGDGRFPQLEHPHGDLPAGTPRPLADLLEGMLAFDPADRPTAAQVAMALEPLIAELPSRMVFSKRGISAR